MTIAPLKRLPESVSSFRRSFLHGVLIGASALAGCRTSEPNYQTASTSKPNPTESQYAWGAAHKPGEKLAAPIPVATAKGSSTIALTSSSTINPSPASLGALHTDSIVLKPVAIQGTDPAAPKPATPAPQSSTGLVPTPVAAPPMASPIQGAPLPTTTIIGGPVVDPSAAPTIFSGDCDACIGGPRNFGVSADQCGWKDNFSTRFGGTVSAINDYSVLGGAVAILESTKQLGRSNLFSHMGVAGEVLDDHWPISFTAGLSRLARIQGDEVCEPWILSATYDGFWDNNIFGSGDDIYTDQLRMLVGFALRPRWDVGAWAAIGGRRDHGEIVVPVAGAAPATFLTARYFANRVAGYSSFDLNDRGAQLITSVGWEDSTGDFFFEADSFIPVRKNVNLFTGMGYSANGSWDGVAGIELLNGAATKQRRPTTGKWGCGDCACETVVECGDRYRGGWANGTYRSALRVLTPSRARRYLANEYFFVPPAPVVVDPAPPVTQTPAPPANDPIVPPPPGNPPPVVNPPPPGNPPPVVNPPPPGNPPPVVTEDPCPPRLPGHTQVEGRLSEWLKSNASQHSQ